METWIRGDVETCYVETGKRGDVETWNPGDVDKWDIATIQDAGIHSIIHSIIFYLP
ncbi:MAG: hypothetical protein KFF73_00595 [Cyclobacteriaceae bacterium]|nr:hypothetical protein [Cyclobacteriaceae bacterium]